MCVVLADGPSALTLQRLLTIEVFQYKENIDSKKEKYESNDDHADLVLDNWILFCIPIGVRKRHHQDNDLQVEKLVEDFDLVEFWLNERFVSDQV